MKATPRAFVRRTAQVMTAAAVAAGGVFFIAAPAYAAVPTITSVLVQGSTTNKIVTAGTTVVITGTGFTGMVDNDARSACDVTPVAWPGTNSGCSQVRFVGNTGTFTRATRYTVFSDTQIYATVPTGIPAVDTTSTVSAPVPGTGSMKVQVVNTMPGGTGSLGSVVGATSEVFYRAPLDPTVTSVPANPNGGGSLTVTVAGITLASGTFVAEKITAYFYNTYATSGDSPKVTSASVTFDSAAGGAGGLSTVKVTVPAGSVSSEAIGLTLLHDGIPSATPDAAAITYPAVITKIESCAVPADINTFVTAYNSAPISPLPTCTGSASVAATASSTAAIKITGKGFTGAGDWEVGGGANDSNAANDGDVTETCAVISDFLAYCYLAITTVPSGNVAVVDFVTDDADNATNPAVVNTGGSILVFTNLV